MDEFVEDLIYKETACDTLLPRLQKRQVMRIDCKQKSYKHQIFEDQGTLKPRQSALEDIDDDDEALMAEIIGETKTETQGVLLGDSELVENPRAAALKVDRDSEERENRDGNSEGEKEERRFKREEKKRQKKEKKASINI